MTPLITQFFVPIAVFGILFVSVTIYKRLQIKKKRRSPFSDSALLRLPGHTLNQEIQELSEDINQYLVGMLIISMMLYDEVRLMASTKGIAPSIKNYPLFYGAFLLIVGFFLFKIFKKMSVRSTLRLGYEGELVTAQELHKIMPEGNHVFHDFPADNFNIDHVVVGPAGVFAIETKARSKKISGNHINDAKACYINNEIVFPDFKDRQYLEQAKRQAKWLANWIKQSTGQSASVFPVVALPGWFVERKMPYDGMFVINPKQLKYVIKSKTVHNMDEKRIQQIIHQLEIKCRNIEIISKQYDS